MATARTCKRTFLDLTEKLEVIDEVKSTRLDEVAKKHGISKTQVYKRMKSKDLINKNRTAAVPIRNASKHRSVKPKFRGIDLAVYEWLRFVRSFNGGRKPLPVSCSLIQAHALHEAKKQNISHFKASNGWFDRWRKAI